MTGVLPITLEESRKISQALLHSGKEYVCAMKLHQQVKKEAVKNILEEFEGEIYQRPPVRSSVKRQLRTRKIYYIDFLEMEARTVLFRVGCEGGTYIRKLCFDVGEVLGCGAHMQELRRTRAGPFTENKNIVTLHELAYYFTEWEQHKDENILKRLIQPMENALTLIPKMYVRDSAVDAICHGAALTAPGVIATEDHVNPGRLMAIFTQKGEAIALARAKVTAEEALNMEKGIVGETIRVLMQRGTYPKLWRSGEK